MPSDKLTAAGSHSETECTSQQCSREAVYAYWCPDLNDFSRVRTSHDDPEDGDLSPFVCEECMKRMADSPHYEADRFLRPEERFITDGGRLRSKTPETCPRCGYNPTGDDEEFRSGGGWHHDHSVVDGLWTETFRCPTCKEVVARDEKEPRADGGRTVRRYEVADEPLAVSYGPVPNREDAYVLALATVMGERVELVFHERPMYDLWTEVKGVPWPEPEHIDEKDRLVRQVLHYANGADEEMLRDALEVLGGGERGRHD